MRRLRQGGSSTPRTRRPCPGRLDRSAVLAWLESRIDFERSPPKRGFQPHFGLARMRRLLTEVGRPQDRLAVVHVAGTKGKGSTVAMLAAILSAAGHRTGRYMSPHVHVLEERICLDGRPISEADLVSVFATVIPAVEALDQSANRRGRRGPTWFEAVTAAALLYFVRARVDIAVLETGLGGRLDATNCSRPMVSVITSVSLDHMALLGRTVGRIAAEKAGIIKRGCQVVSGALHPSARRVIATTATRRRAPLWQLGRDFTATYQPPPPDEPLAGGWVELAPPLAVADGRGGRYRLAMAGQHQAENAALAIVAALAVDAKGLTVPDRAIARGLAAVELPARIERLAGRPTVIVDAAHNVASMQSLVAALAPALSRTRPRVLLFASSADKQIEEMLASTRGLFDHVVVTRYVSNPRAAPIERLVAACRRAGLPMPAVVEPPPAALAAARALAGRSGVVCVAGSFFLAAEVRNCR